MEDRIQDNHNDYLGRVLSDTKSGYSNYNRSELLYYIIQFLLYTIFKCRL